MGEEKDYTEEPIEEPAGGPEPIEDDFFEEEIVEESPMAAEAVEESMEEAAVEPPPFVEEEMAEAGYEEEAIPPEAPAWAAAGGGGASDTYTEVTRTGWGGRLGGAVKGMIFGLILFIAGFPLLFWNEGRAVKRYKALEEGAGVVVSVPADTVNAANEGNLIHVVGLADTKEVLADGAGVSAQAASVSSDRADPANNGKLIHVAGMAAPGGVLPDRDFGVSAAAIKLERRVAMFQWIEQGDAYVRGWETKPIDSNRFQQPQGHENPRAMPFRSKRLVSQNVKVGVFQVPRQHLGKLDHFEPLRLTSEDVDLPQNMVSRVRIHNGGLYIGNDPGAPAIGDVMISYRVVPPTVVTLIGQQNGTAVEPYPTGSGAVIERFAVGEKSPGDLMAGGVSANALRMKRDVRMYQWTERTSSETRKKLGGGEETVTTYSYEKSWSDRVISSDSFKKPEGHANPPAMPIEDGTWTARNATVGAFRLPPGMVNQVGRFEPLPVTTIASSIPADLRTRTRIHQGGYYIGQDPQYPRIGDLQVSYSVVRPTRVSIMAMQQGDTFAPYQTKTGRIQELRNGTYTADDMFKAAEQSNKTMTWILRAAGFMAMFIGIGMMLKPLSVALDVVPFLGNLAESGIGIVSFLMAAGFALATISIAWLFYRPLIGGGMLAGAVILVAGAKMMSGKKAAA